MNTYTTMSYREIAPRYNAINRLPDEAGAAFGAAVSDVARGRRVLDLGAGAGRLALPAALCGIEVTALDFEFAMIAQAARDAQAADVPLGALQADGVRLPFSNGAFGVVVINNVLHLVSDWPQVLREVQRVLTPDGVLLMGRDVLDPRSAASQLRNNWRRIVAELRPEMRPTSAAGPALPMELAKLGARIEAERTVASWVECISPADLLERMRTREHNETWSLDDQTLDAGLPRLREWAAAALRVDDVEEVHWSFAVTKVHGLAQEIVA